MAEVVNSLFGITPESLQARRDAELQAQALQYAKLDPFQRATAAIYSGANRLGGAVGGMLGAQDPEMVKATALQSIMRQADTTTPEGLATLARTLSSQGFGAQAMQVMDQAQQAQLRVAQTNKASAELRQKELTVAQEQKLREELAALGPTATEDEYLQVVRKYGDPNRIMQSIETRLSKQAAAEAKAKTDKEAADAKVEAAKAAADARIEAAKLAAENRLEVARQQGATQLQIAQLAAQSRQEIAALTASLKQGQQSNKPLSPGLQKEEGKDLEAIDSYTGQIQALTPAVASLTPNAQGVRSLELGPLKNLKYEAQLAAGNSTPEARAYESLKSAVDTATNLQVSAEKGVQTDKDVLRFAKALIASYGRNDTQATFEALTRYQKALQQAQERTKGRIESRRKAQGVSSFYEGSSQGPQVIKLD
jgi:colicin import membrane protein